jgi:hypothetical protein
MANFCVRGNMLLIRRNMAISLPAKDSSKLSFAAPAAEVFNRKESSGAMSRIVTYFQDRP